MNDFSLVVGRPRVCLRASTRGVALVITLALLVLVTALVMTLFLTVTNERTESAAAANQGDAQHLAHSVVNLVKSTITQATCGYEANSDGTPITSSPTTWASQPGLIRTWKHDGAQDRSYRLYSSGSIVTTGSLDIAEEASLLNSWKSGNSSYNALWCDLNAPATNESGQRVYPIITPPADNNSGSTATDPAYGVPTDTPSNTSIQQGVQGFSIKGPPGYSNGNAASAANNPAPMPVKWLYLLQDGSFVTPAGTGTTVTINNATKTNPIVARVAYWTDDETCKVNINTASEYCFWEPPTTFTNPDAMRATYQPGVNEYQRYPGHPATTSISAVFEKLGPQSSPETDGERATRYQKAFNLAPRIAGTGDGLPYTSGGNGAGSQAGTAVSWISASAGGNSAAIAIDADRLYASAEDLLYSPKRAEQLVSQGILANAGDLQSRLCFLTTHSTSPDVNWMNQPRISLWPLNPNETAKWSATDKLLDYCGRVRGATTDSIYYFQRTSGFDPQADAQLPRNIDLYKYLKNMLDTPIPGAGGAKFSGKASRDSQQLLTNIFDYIRCFINNRYSGGSIGTGSNATDDPAKSYYFPPGQPNGKFGCFAPAPTLLKDGNKITRGPGGYPVVSDVLLHFWALAPGESLPDNNGTSQTTDYPSPATSGTTLKRTVQMNLLLNLYKPSWNNVCPSPQYQIRVSGDQSWTVTSGTDPLRDANVISGNLNFPKSEGSILRVYSYHKSENNIAQWGGPTSLEWLYRGAADLTTSYVTRSFSRTPGPGTFTLYGDPIQVTIQTGTAIGRTSYKDEGVCNSATYLLTSAANPAMMNFHGGLIKIEIFPGIKDGRTSGSDSDSYDVTNTTPIQTISLNVPDFTIPVPTLGGTDTNYSGALSAGGNGTTAFHEMGHWANRGQYAVPGAYIQMHCPGNPDCMMDSVRSFSLNVNAAHKGDLRVLAHERNIPSNWYTPDFSGTEREFLTATNSYLRNVELLGNGRANAAKLDSHGVYTGYISTKIAAYALNGMSRGGVLDVGDFTNGFSISPLGGYYMQSDMGWAGRSVSTANFPYSSLIEYSDARSAYNGLTYSPARMVGSPIILGKLSTYVSLANPNPWETLLFCPNPHGGADSHTGWSDPKDHYLLDLFTMPVVEPYAISQPLSTDGRINLNQQMAPFDYITRNTGLYAAIKGTRVYAIADPNAIKYASLTGNTTTVGTDFTLGLDVDSTIAGINARAPFKTASEFTECFLIPQGQSATTVDQFWRKQKGTGDDLREAPYNDIYPKLTTKSNTFTVHMLVQSLKQVPGGRSTAADWQAWNESKDQVVSEYRGSATIERYIDPNDTTIPDFAARDGSNYNKNLAPYYRWRTIAEHQFVP